LRGYQEATRLFLKQEKQNTMNKLAQIIETHINGNITIAKKQAMLWKINPFQIIECSEIFGLNKTISLLKTFDVYDRHIINAFHDYKRSDIDEVKTILLNNFY